MRKRIEAIIHRLDESGKLYTADEVVAAYQLPDDDEHCLRAFSHKLVEHLKRTGKAPPRRDLHFIREQFPAFPW